MKKAAFLLVVGSLCLAIRGDVYAESALPELTPGMSSKAVLDLWGEPTEREEQETKRLELWRYPKGALVVFHEGVVSDWNPVVSLISQRSVALREKPVGVKHTPVGVNQDTRDLVREIAREVPSGPDVSGPSEPVELLQQNPVPNMPAPIQPGVVMNQPMGIPAGQSVVIDE